MPSVQERRSSVLLKSIRPKGRILNDNGSGVDHLGTAVYAKAIANQITDVSTPVTFGIFARWGSGKSFLIKHIQSIIRKRDKMNRSKSKAKKSKCKSIFLLLAKIFSGLIMVGMVVVLIMLIISPSLFGLITDDQFKITRFAAGSVLIAVLAIIGAGFLKRVKLYKHGFSKIAVLAYARFTKLPILEPEHNIAGVKKEKNIDLKLDDTEQKNLFNVGGKQNDDAISIEKPIRYIFVNFNAWQYSGSDNLWAGIVLTLAKAVEREFSSITSRLFRGIILQKIANETRKPLPIIYVKIKGQPPEKVFEIANKYGTVIEHKVCRCSKPNSDEWWSITYSCNSEADLAIHMLSRISITAQRKHPFSGYLPKVHKKKTGFYAHFKKYARKHFCIADLYWLLIFGISVVAIPIVVLVVIQIPTNLDNNQAADTGLIFSQVIVWLPAGFSFIYVIASTVYAMVKSQTDRLMSLLKGIEGNLANELGFMHKVKEEVMHMTDLIHTVELVYNVKYKVIIAIDDLDRIPLPKIRLVLESVNILLSDRSSPFICLIAVDSRIAVESLELPDRFAEQVPRISGHEYLKKIINIPFCLPEITESDKKNYVAGLIDDSDTTTSHAMLHQYKDEMDEEMSNRESRLGIGTCILDDETVRDGNSFCDDYEEITVQTQSYNVYGDTVASAENIAMKEFATEKITTRRAVRSEQPIHHLESINEVASRCNGFDSVSNASSGDAIYGFGEDINDDCINFNAINPNSFPVRPEQDEQHRDHVNVNPYEDIPFSITQRPKHQNISTDVIWKPPASVIDPKANLDKFLLHCRKHLLDQFLINHLGGNPRNIKRIFNIISLTALIVGCHQENEIEENELSRIAKMSNNNLTKASAKTSNPYRKPKHKMDKNLAKDIVTWVLLTDQWPYRSSYLLQVIEDSDQRIDDKESYIPDEIKLYDIYKDFVLKEISLQDHEILNLDGDPDIFRRFLKKQHLLKSTVKRLLKYTINVDQGLRNKVALRRAVCFIEAKQQPQESIRPNQRKGENTFRGTNYSRNLSSERITHPSPSVSTLIYTSENTMPKTGLVEVDAIHDHKELNKTPIHHPTTSNAENVHHKGINEKQTHHPTMYNTGRKPHVPPKPAAVLLTG